jgi:hypothetical protein
MNDSFKEVGAAQLDVSALPLRRELTIAYTLSLVIVLLVAAAALSGLLLRSSIYETETLIMAFVPGDLFHLTIGLPVLLGSMALARRGRLAGLLSWPGALLYLLYSYVTNLLGVPFGPLFLPYLLLVILNAYTLIALVASIDAGAVRRRLVDRVPVKGAGGLLTALTALFILNAVVEIITALSAQEPVGPLQIMLWITDLTTIAPLCLVGGIMLLRRRALGYAGATGLLFAYSLLFLAVLPAMAFPALYAGTPVDGIGMVLMFVAGLLCFTLWLRFARAADAPTA